MGIRYSIGTTTCKLARDKIAPGEILEGNITIGVHYPVKISEVTVRLKENEYVKYKVRDWMARFKYGVEAYNVIESYEILKKSVGRKKPYLNYEFKFKLPESMQGSSCSYGEDYRYNHSYCIETTIKTFWWNYISIHEIDVRSVLSDSTYHNQIENKEDIPKIISIDTYKKQKDGILRVSPFDIHTRNINISAFYDFSNEARTDYKVKLSLYKYTVFHKVYFAELIREAECYIPSSSTMMAFSSLFVLDNELFPSYQGRYGSIVYQLFFTVENPNKIIMDKVFEDYKVIPIQSHYYDYKQYSEQVPIVNRVLYNINSDAKVWYYDIVLGASILAGLGLISIPVLIRNS